MSDLAETFKAFKEHKKELKENWKKDHLEDHLAMLDRYPDRLSYEVKNHGEHYILTITENGKKTLVDLWPSTGKWIVRRRPKNPSGRGIPNLLKYFKLPTENSERFIMQD